MNASEELNKAMNAIYLEVPEAVADDVCSKIRAREHELMVALGYFLNGEDYASTFPDNEEDGKQLQKSATWNRLTGRNLLSEKDQWDCGERMKQHATQQPEHLAMMKKIEEKWANKPTQRFEADGE